MIGLVVLAVSESGIPGFSKSTCLSVCLLLVLGLYTFRQHKLQVV